MHSRLNAFKYSFAYEYVKKILWKGAAYDLDWPDDQGS